MRTMFVALLLLWGICSAEVTAAQETVSGPALCADCHGGMAADKVGALNHADSVSCLSCHHIGFTDDPRTAVERRLDACADCHTDLLASHSGVDDTDADLPECTQCHSIHGDPPVADAAAALSATCVACHGPEHTLHAQVAEEAPECTQCHTVHTGAAFHPRNDDVVESCAACHESVHPAHAEVEEGFSCTDCHVSGGAELAQPTAAETADQCASCHVDLHPAHAAVERDEAPQCVECHDFARDVPMEQDGPRVAERCGACHEDELAGFRAGGHAEAIGDVPNPDLPTCVTCHTTHRDPTQASSTSVAATVQCVQCHSDESLADQYGIVANVGASFTDDFHGATVQFQMDGTGSADDDAVLVCADCHGAHEVGWDEDESAVAEVCARCHDEGDDRLAGAWLGHDRIGPKNGTLVWLVRLGYMFLIPFMLTGLMLTIGFQFVDQRRKGARLMKTEGMQRLLAWIRREKTPPVETVQRFSLTERLEHAGSMITFILLVVTGLPQTRPDLAAAHWVIALFGGIGSTRLIHRVVGFAFVALMLLHVVRGVAKAVRARRLPIMVPVRKDFQDVLQTFKHYLWGTKRPKVGKFDFSQKFEYWGLFLGGIVMSSTGIILVFPELVTQVLPGVVVAAMRTVHGLEATFAVLVIVLWHSYGVSLRPEIFPLDTTIFTGRMSVHRLEEEHQLEYERLFPGRALSEPDEDEPEGPDPTPELLRRLEDRLAGA